MKLKINKKSSLAVAFTAAFWCFGLPSKTLNFKLAHNHTYTPVFNIQNGLSARTNLRFCCLIRFVVFAVWSLNGATHWCASTSRTLNSFKSDYCYWCVVSLLSLAAAAVFDLYLDNCVSLIQCIAIQHAAPHFIARFFAIWSVTNERQI